MGIDRSEMNMMGTLSISSVFAIIFLVISALLVFHIVFTLWGLRNQLQELIKHYSRLVHSLTMSLGMISTMTICTITGAIMRSYISTSYIIALIISIFISGIICFPFKDEIAVIDGIISGSMGGLMGTMLAFMIPTIGFYTVTVLLTALFAATWVIMRRRINTQFQFIHNNKQQMDNNLKETEFY